MNHNVYIVATRKYQDKKRAVKLLYSQEIYGCLYVNFKACVFLYTIDNKLIINCSLGLIPHDLKSLDWADISFVLKIPELHVHACKLISGLFYT